MYVNIERWDMNKSLVFRFTKRLSNPFFPFQFEKRAQ